MSRHFFLALAAVAVIACMYLFWLEPLAVNGSVKAQAVFL